MATGEPSEDDLLARWERVVEAVTRTQERVAEQIERAGVPSQWFAALRALLRAEDHRLPMSHLAREMSISTGGFTKLADRMGREGLIDRRNSTGDRRVVYAALTPAGIEVATRAEEAYLAAMREFVLGQIPADLLQVVDRTLGALDAPALAESDDAAVGVVTTPRDPSLPERRHGDACR